MTTVDDYVSRIDGTCGKEKDVIVTFKYEKRDKAIKTILKRASLKKSLAGIVFELAYGKYSFRLYTSGKAILRGLENKEELTALLSELLL
jgi:TATA-box binding protein (TBP) (component of TFIID and TFIIIB)